MSHPVAGGDASFVLALSEPLLRELAPAALLQQRDQLGFRRGHLRIDPRAQALAAVLRHNLQMSQLAGQATIEPLEADGLFGSINPN